MVHSFAGTTPAIPSHSPGEQPDAWTVYILRCSDGSLYTGVTTDLTRRLQEHNFAANGARYTRSRRPVHLVHAEIAANRSAACRREYQLKQLSRAAKEKLVATTDMPSCFIAKEL